MVAEQTRQRTRYVTIALQPGRYVITEIGRKCVVCESMTEVERVLRERAEEKTYG